MVPKMRAPSVEIDGLDDYGGETSFEVSSLAKNTLDAKACFPTLWYAFDAGCKVSFQGDGEGGLSLRVDNKGGLVHKDASAEGISTFLQKGDLATAAALCDLSNKYRAALYAAEGDSFIPSDAPPCFDFEGKYASAAEAFKTKRTSLDLDKTAGSSFSVGGVAMPVEAASLVEALEAVNVMAAASLARERTA